MDINAYIFKMEDINWAFIYNEVEEIVTRKVEVWIVTLLKFSLATYKTYILKKFLIEVRQKRLESL